MPDPSVAVALTVTEPVAVAVSRPVEEMEALSDPEDRLQVTVCAAAEGDTAAAICSVEPTPISLLLEETVIPVTMLESTSSRSSPYFPEPSFAVARIVI